MSMELPPPPDADELLLAGAPAGALLLLELLLLPHAANRSSDPTIRHTLIVFARTLIKKSSSSWSTGLSVALDCGRVVARSDRNNLEIAVWRPRAAPLNRK
jgi:hypothetical protein